MSRRAVHHTRLCFSCALIYNTVGLPNVAVGVYRITVSLHAAWNRPSRVRMEFAAYLVVQRTALNLQNYPRPIQFSTYPG